MLTLTKKFTSAFSVSGAEKPLADIIAKELAPVADAIETDAIGNLYVLKKGKDSSRKLMIAAHMDEIGFVVTSIDGDGYLKIAALSGRDPKTLAGRNVTVGDETKQYKGYFGVKPAHLGGSGNFDSLYIDIGAKKLVLETLLKLNREQGMTVVMASSELMELRSICDRIAIVAEGKVVDVLPVDSSDADFGLAMSGIKPGKEA